MRISHKHKFVWISNPKTGSTSFRQALTKYSDIVSSDNMPYFHHVTLKQLKVHFETKKWSFDAYLKICASRNPWDKVISIYSYSKPDVFGNMFWDKPQYLPDQLISFSDWLLLETTENKLRTIYTLENYILDYDGQKLADFVFSIDTDYKNFFTILARQCELHLKPEHVPYMNSTTKSEGLMVEVARVFNTSEADDLIRRVFAYEIDMFEYQNPYT